MARNAFLRKGDVAPPRSIVADMEAVKNMRTLVYVEDKWVTESRKLVARSMTEAQFQKQVLELAKLFKWRRYHSRAAMMRSGRWSTPMQGDKGFPDLVLIRPPRIVFAELKREKGAVLSVEQAAWLADLGLCRGAETYLWTPSDMPEIERLLRAA